LRHVLKLTASRAFGDSEMLFMEGPVDRAGLFENWIFFRKRLRRACRRI
jgi:hypothetical protein